MKLSQFRSESGYGEVSSIVWLLVVLLIVFILVPPIFHLSWAVFGPLGALIVLVLIVLLFTGR